MFCINNHNRILTQEEEDTKTGLCKECLEKAKIHDADFHRRFDIDSKNREEKK
jgi:hypothetical protein